MNEIELKLLAEYLDHDYMNLTSYAKELSNFLEYDREVHPNVLKYVENLNRDIKDFEDEVYKREGFYIGEGGFLLGKPFENLLQTKNLQEYLTRIIELKSQARTLISYCITPSLYEDMIADKVPDVFDNPDRLSDEELQKIWDQNYEEYKEQKRIENDPKRIFENDPWLPEGFKIIENPELSQNYLYKDSEWVTWTDVKIEDLLAEFPEKAKEIEKNLWMNPAIAKELFFDLASRFIQSGIIDQERIDYRRLFMDPEKKEILNERDATERYLAFLRHFPDRPFITIAAGTLTEDYILDGKAVLLKGEKLGDTRYQVSIMFSNYKDGYPKGHLVSLELWIGRNHHLNDEEYYGQFSSDLYDLNLSEEIYEEQGYPLFIISSYGSNHSYEKRNITEESDEEYEGRSLKDGTSTLNLHPGDMVNFFEDF